MAVFSVDSDAVLTASTQVRGTIGRLQTETATMTSQLGDLQTRWTGTAASAFVSAVDQWRAAQRQLEDALGTINEALGAAGRQYADTELYSANLFR